MSEWITVVELAKELGVPAYRVTVEAKGLGIPAVRGAAKLRESQANQLRQSINADRTPTRLATKPPLPPMRRERDVDDDGSVYGGLQPGPFSAVVSCGCCHLRFHYDRSRVTSSTPAPLTCKRCLDHLPESGEASERIIRRISAHLEWTTQGLELASKAAKDAETAKEEAYEKRNKWRIALVETILAHEEVGQGRCTCGAANYPCFTVKKLAEVNRGISRDVERLASMSDVQRARVLHGRDSAEAREAERAAQTPPNDGDQAGWSEDF